MKEIIEKLSSYNIFNNLLPGIVFVVFAEVFTKYSFIQKDIILGVFVYYFIGLVISRLGSIAIEPLFKWMRIVKFADYSEYVSAEKKDNQIAVLSEANNMYRSFISLFALLVLLKVYELSTNHWPIIGQWSAVILLLGLIALFGYSYRKQTKYITNRIEVTNKKR